MEEIREFALRELGNSLIERIKVESFSTYLNEKRFENICFPQVSLSGSDRIEECSLDLPGEALERLSQERSLALTREEMQHLSKYFSEGGAKEERRRLGLPAGPTDVELEIIAQTWSEHCKHKIFAARIDYVENVEGFHPVGSRVVKGLYPVWIKGATRRIERERGIDWTKSVFSDNAGVVRFDPHVDFCIKVETHNSPSALDPYGGH